MGSGDKKCLKTRINQKMQTFSCKPQKTRRFKPFSIPYVSSLHGSWLHTYEVYYNRKVSEVDRLPQNLITPSLAMSEKSASPSGMVLAIASATLDRRESGVKELTMTQMAYKKRHLASFMKRI